MNKLTKLLPIILIAAALLAANIQYSNATDSLLISSYGSANYGGFTTYAVKTHPTSNGGYYSSAGQTVFLNASYYVGLFQVYGFIEYSTDGNATIVAQIYNNTDNELVNVPSTDNAPCATSNNTYNMEDFTGDTTAGWWNFYFNNTLLTAGNYSFVVTCNYEGYPFAATYLKIGVDNTSPTDAGQFVDYHSSAWEGLASRDMIYYVYTEADGGGMPTPTPAATTTPTDSNATNALIETFTDILVPLIIFLLPALILGWLTHWQKWPVLIGLAIGAGLAYMFLGTAYLWLVVTVIIGIAAMAYSEFKSGGG